MGRRHFLKLLTTSLALLGGCRRAAEIVPAVVERENLDSQFATTLSYRDFGRGVLVETLGGRPVGLVGHGSGTDPQMHAALLDLYDPSRRFGTTDLGRLSGLIARARVAEGRGLAILSRPLRSPLLEAQRQRLQQAMPRARWFVHDPAPATLSGFDRPYLAHYELEHARLIVSFDEDFLGTHPDRLRLAGQFAEHRQPGPEMSRLYVLESSPSATGQVADHCRRLHPAALEQALWALAKKAGVHHQDGQDSPLVRALVHELDDHQGRCVVMGGPWLSPGAQVLIHRLNQKFRGLVSYSAEPQEEGLEPLRQGLEKREVRWLLILGGDPVMESGGELRLDGLERSVHLSEFANQTSQACQLAIPRAHPLESWGDRRYYDGRVGFVQPLVEPLYGGVSDHEVLALLLGERLAPLEALRRHYGSRLDLARGWLEQEQPPHEPVERAQPAAPAQEEPLLLFRPDPHLVDGGLAHNAWLQELPRPLTGLCWGQPALASGDLEEGRHLALSTQRAQLEVPHYQLEQHPANCATLYLGPEAYRLGHALWQTPVKMQPGQGFTEVITTQHHHVIEWELFGEQPTESLYPEPEPGQVAWGMVIDLNRCIGCNACTVACQSENNIPVVGPQEVARGREMHWIRIDSYFKPQQLFVPVPCMHCEHAPCEQVCPVEATLHSHDGLNEMIYNRCVGTRYCSNNCPYKVRRFNFFNYVDPRQEVAPLRNPQVTVRDRGVMEKCSYCVQRIRKADIAARKANRPIADGEVITACQAACPTRAITFGNLADPDSAVARLARDPRNTSMLAELNTRPHTTYLEHQGNPRAGLEPT